MESTYSIDIIDKQGKQVGELMTATPMQILSFINKGFDVIDKATGLKMSEEMLTSTIGVSDGVIDVG